MNRKCGIAIVVLALAVAAAVVAGQMLSRSGCYVVEAERMRMSGYRVDTLLPQHPVRLTGKTGTLNFVFERDSGRYDVDACYLSEQVGQNTYAMYVNGTQIVAWLGKDRDDRWHKLSEQRWHSPRNIPLKRGDSIRIEALSQNGSQATLDYVAFTRSATKSLATVANPEAKTPVEEQINIGLDSADCVTVCPQEYAEAFKNPLKGFRGSNVDHEYATLIKTYFKWNELEENAAADTSQIREACDKRWAGFAERNIKAIPRVYLQWPGQESGYPSDMTEGDYTSEQFRQRVLGLIGKLAAVWDKDPRVAYVEMGLIGQWGEMEFPDTSDEIKDAISRAFHENFKNKLVMIRWPNTYNDHLYNFGYYWDSFAHYDQDYCGYYIQMTSPKWQTAVMGGETAFDWGNASIQPGNSPETALKKAVHRDYIIDRIRRLHVNHLGWIASYDHQDKDVRAGAAIMQKCFGYRFVITEFCYPKVVGADRKLRFSFRVRNTGSSPFYYNWPVEISLLDPQTREVRWKANCTDLDIRKWLPGDEWNSELQSYASPARTYTVNQEMSLAEVPDGEYVLSVAILDPAGGLPCARFAISNYYKGGRHPMGRIGIGRTLESFTVSDFDDIREDNTLHYISHR